eukprot:2163704-Rhodomonas_salina.6
MRRQYNLEGVPTEPRDGNQRTNNLFPSPPTSVPDVASRNRENTRGEGGVRTRMMWFKRCAIGLQALHALQHGENCDIATPTWQDQTRWSGEGDVGVRRVGCGVCRWRVGDGTATL